MMVCRTCGAEVSIAPCPFCGSSDVVPAAGDAPTQILPPAGPPTQVMPSVPTQVMPTTPPPPLGHATIGGVTPPPSAATSATPPASTYSAAPGAPKRWVPWLIVALVLALIGGIGGAFALGAFTPAAPPPATPAPAASTARPATPSARPSVASPSTTPSPSPTAPDAAATAPSAPAPAPTLAPSAQPETTVYSPAPAPTKTVVVVQPLPGQSSSYPTVRIAAGKECSRAGKGPFSAAGTANSTTSCGFANNVRDAYIARLNGADGTIQAYSPTTQQTYDVTCSGRQPVLCVGGRAGRVILYGGELVVG